MKHLTFPSNFHFGTRKNDGNVLVWFYGTQLSGSTFLRKNSKHQDIRRSAGKRLNEILNGQKKLKCLND